MARVFKAVVAGMMQAIQQPARASIVTESVPPESLTNAIGLTSLIYNLARLVGPASAGAILAIGDTSGAFAVQGGSFAFREHSENPFSGRGRNRSRRFGRSEQRPSAR